MADTDSALSSAYGSSRVNCYNYNYSGSFSMQVGVFHDRKESVSDIVAVMLP